MKSIKYQIMTRVNYGTEEEPNIVETFNDVEIQCPDANFDANYTVALSEAYNGEVTVEDIPDEDRPATDTEVLNTFIGEEV